MDLGLYSWFAFLETLGRVWGTRFYVWCLRSLGSCLLVCLQRASFLMMGFEGRKWKLSIYDYKPAWIARYDEGMITGLGLLHGVGHWWV
jgi:hypothetical protein